MDPEHARGGCDVAAVLAERRIDALAPRGTIAEHAPRGRCARTIGRAGSRAMSLGAAKGAAGVVGQVLRADEAIIVAGAGSGIPEAGEQLAHVARPGA